MSRIVAICDCFDAMTAHRSYQKHPFTPYEALHYMTTKIPERFDSTLLKVFIQTVGIFPPGTLVRGDPVLLEQALVNLLENAVTHAGSGSRVRVATAPPDDGLVRLTVEDSGPGVADAALPRVFDRFYRGDVGRRGTSGTGIGLAVVRGFVEAMGGRVSSRRGELGGLAVDIELPSTSIPADVPEHTDVLP